MEFKGLGDAATCNSKELVSVTLSSPLPGIQGPSRMHLSLKHLAPKEMNCIQLKTRDLKLRSITFLEMKMLLLNYSYICETIFAITTNWFIHKAWFRFLWKEMSCVLSKPFMFNIKYFIILYYLDFTEKWVSWWS